MRSRANIGHAAGRELLLELVSLQLAKILHGQCGRYFVGTGGYDQTINSVKTDRRKFIEDEVALFLPFLLTSLMSLEIYKKRTAP